MSETNINKLRDRQPKDHAAIAQLEARELRIKCAKLEAENKRLDISEYKIIRLKAAMDIYESGCYKPKSIKGVMVAIKAVLYDDEAESEANND